MQNHCSTEVRNSHVAKNLEFSMVWWHWLPSRYFGGRGQPGLSNTPNSKCANKKKDSKSRSWASLLSCGIQDMAPLAKARNAVCPVLHKDMCCCPSCGRTIVWSPAPPGFSDKQTPHGIQDRNFFCLFLCVGQQLSTVYFLCHIVFLALHQIQ